MGAGCLMDPTGKMIFFAFIPNQYQICELVMPPTGVFDGEQKPEAKKRCERAESNTAGL